MKIIIFTNDVAGGWEPDDIDRFLGGSEESVVLLSEALIRYGFEVDVYHTKKPGVEEKKVSFMGVNYKWRVITKGGSLAIVISCEGYSN